MPFQISLLPFLKVWKLAFDSLLLRPKVGNKLEICSQNLQS